MRAKAFTKPPESGFWIEEAGEKCNVHFYENVIEEDGYEFDWYVIRNVNFHLGLKESIEKRFNEWLEIAKKGEEEEFDEIQLIEQSITELEIENIMLGQMITDLEIMVMEGLNV